MKIGIDIGGSHIAIGIVDENGRIVEKLEKSWSDAEKQNIKKAIEDCVIENVLKLCEKYEITEVGMAVPGRAENGTIISSGNVGIKNYPIVEKLKDKIKLPIKIQNDAKCAAIAENKYGCLKQWDRGMFLTLGTGIGGAVFLDNKLLKAGRKPGYEFGHMVIEKNGIPCVCGRRGCFERYASMKVFKSNLKNALNLDKSTHGEELLNIIRNNKLGNANYEKIEKVIKEYIENLSIGILNLISIFEPEIIGIGGSFVYFEEVLLTRLRESIAREDIKIETAILGNDAGIIGAVL